MPEHLQGLLAAAVGLGALLALVEGVPGLDFVIQLGAFGGLIGTGHALVERIRDSNVDPWPIIAGWTLGWAGFGVLIQVGSEVLSAR